MKDTSAHPKTLLPRVACGLLHKARQTDGKRESHRGGNKKMMGLLSGACKCFRICLRKFSFPLYIGRVIEMNAQMDSELIAETSLSRMRRRKNRRFP